MKEGYFTSLLYTLLISPNIRLILLLKWICQYYRLFQNILLISFDIKYTLLLRFDYSYHFKSIIQQSHRSSKNCFIKFFSFSSSFLLANLKPDILIWQDLHISFILLLFLFIVNKTKSYCLLLKN